MTRRSPGSLPRIVSRPLQDDGDWWRLRRLLTEIVPLAHPGFCWDVRRLDGARFHHPDPARNPRWRTLTQLWETAEGRLVGAVNHEARGDAYLQVHPDFRQLEEEMVAWAEEMLAVPASPGAERELELVAFEHDERRRDLLARRGYEQTGDWVVTRHLRLGRRPQAAPHPVVGYAVRTTRMGDVGDCERIAAVLNAGFERTIHTAAEVEAFAREAPSFRADLDLVAVAPDGAFAAYVGVAYDEANRRGIVEPVCTHPDHRRQGLARALIEEGLLCLEAHGAVDAVVETGAMEAANALYSALGFTEAYRADVWKRAL